MNLWEPLWSPVTNSGELYAAQILAATLLGAL
jgi:hypothetical protein